MDLIKKLEELNAKKEALMNDDLSEIEAKVEAYRNQLIEEYNASKESDLAIINTYIKVINELIAEEEAECVPDAVESTESAEEDTTIEEDLEAKYQAYLDNGGLSSFEDWKEQQNG